MVKSRTDLHWNERALSEANDAAVNMHDTVQRDLELDFVFAHLPPQGRVLEVGCGNGYVTQQVRDRVAYVDGFDLAENMIERARRTYGDNNNRFFHGSVLDRTACAGNGYDAAICVRVLINLRDLQQQQVAIANMAHWLKPGGRLILVEGFRDGFAALDRLREECSLPPLVPAPINYYSSLAELWPRIMEFFDVADEYHTGTFDFLTRIVLPRIADPDRPETFDNFHAKIQEVARCFNPDDLKPLARVRGFALVKR